MSYKINYQRIFIEVRIFESLNRRKFRRNLFNRRIFVLRNKINYQRIYNVEKNLSLTKANYIAKEKKILIKIKKRQKFYRNLDRRNLMSKKEMSFYIDYQVKEKEKL